MDPAIHHPENHPSSTFFSLNLPEIPYTSIRMDKIDGRKLRLEMADYQRPSRWRSIWQLINTLVPFVVLWYVAYRTLEYSYWLTLPVIVVLAGLMIRAFIIFHDCGHGSFFRSEAANSFWGWVTGILTVTPYRHWRARHARHHGTSGNLDKRGQGDIWMMTRDEYIEASRSDRLKYRLYRNPIVMFLLGPLLITLIKNRLAGKNANRSDRISAYVTNLAIVAVATTMIFLIGWKALLIIQLPAVFLAHIFGVWLFYVQHQFDGVYWKRETDWDFVTAALEGGSFYKLPGILRWFTGSIGYHHVHHLNPSIPNYNLSRCENNLTDLHQTKPIGLFSSLKALSLRLWDEDSEKMIGFKDIRSSRGSSAVA